MIMKKKQRILKIKDKNNPQRCQRQSCNQEYSMFINDLFFLENMIIYFQIQLVYKFTTVSSKKDTVLSNIEKTQKFGCQPLYCEIIKKIFVLRTRSPAKGYEFCYNFYYYSDFLSKTPELLVVLSLFCFFPRSARIRVSSQGQYNGVGPYYPGYESLQSHFSKLTDVINLIFIFFIPIFQPTFFSEKNIKF